MEKAQRASHMAAAKAIQEAERRAPHCSALYETVNCRPVYCFCSFMDALSV